MLDSSFSWRNVLHLKLEALIRLSPTSTEIWQGFRDCSLISNRARFEKCIALKTENLGLNWITKLLEELGWNLAKFWISSWEPKPWERRQRLTAVFLGIYLTFNSQLWWIKIPQVTDKYMHYCWFDKSIFVKNYHIF